VLDRIARDAKAVGEARTSNTDATWFEEKFDWPADGPLSGLYGSQRILNGEPREPHYGIDIAAPAGAPVRAPAEGIVRMAEDLYLSGNTLILDHGHGVSTSYLHMTRFDVKLGDHVKRAAILGRVGATGRATGPHLCWRMNWFQTRLDAALSAVPRPDKACRRLSSAGESRAIVPALRERVPPRTH
jgi:murein DD-endopeptidase MepM/ murein hydrolase activator NlpD